MKRFLLMFGIFFVVSSFVLTGCGKPPDSKSKPPKGYVAKPVSRPAPKVEKPAPATPAQQAAPPVAETAAKPAPVPSAGATGGADGDILEMKNTNAFDPHKMAIVMFSHAKHFSAAPGGYGIACGECHHDKDGNPLALKIGDSVQGCMECHDKPGKTPKKPTGISADEWDAMQLEYYYGAIHANCIDCHKAGGAGPVKCTDCHIKP